MESNKFVFSVERVRSSVTQGEVKVFCNGEFITNFFDKIELIKPGQKFYGDNIGGWASVTPDSAFIKGVLFHPLDHFYHISDYAANFSHRLPCLLAAMSLHDFSL